MNGRAFKLGTFARPNGKPFAAIVLDDTAIDLAQAHEAYRASGRPALSSTSSIQDLLDDWERNFATLQEIVAFLDRVEYSPLVWVLGPWHLSDGRRVETSGARRSHQPQQIGNMFWSEPDLS